jgi:uracil-DNA glycosylase
MLFILYLNKCLSSYFLKDLKLLLLHTISRFIIFDVKIRSIMQIHEEIKIECSWKSILKEEFEKPYFSELNTFLKSEKAAGKIIYPPMPLVFNAFDAVPFDQVKVVILGQDPYHGAGEAHGLSFSVPRGVKVPPSLKKIYKELEKDIDGFKAPAHGCLEPWAEQGVFMLNAFLTVEADKPKSHQKIGWEKFTDAIIKLISDQKTEIVFMLWGGFARKKVELIDANKHLILEAAHPSPLAGNAFLGCRHFSATNNFFKEKGRSEIDWRLPE